MSGSRGLCKFLLSLQPITANSLWLKTAQVHPLPFWRSGVQNGPHWVRTQESAGLGLPGSSGAELGPSTSWRWLHPLAHGFPPSKPVMAGQARGPVWENPGLFPELNVNSRDLLSQGAASPDWAGGAGVKGHGPASCEHGGSQGRGFPASRPTCLSLFQDRLPRAH